MNRGVWVLFALLVLSSAACSKGETVSLETPAAEGAAEAQAVPITAARAAMESITTPIEATGRTRALREANIATDVVAPIHSIAVSEGQEVRRGATLVRLDLRGARAQAAEASARAAQARAYASQSESRSQRLLPLTEAGVLPPSEGEQVAADRAASVEAARAAEASVEAFQATLARGVLKAPFDGVVAEIPVEVGEMAAGSQTTLVRLLDLHEVEVTVRVGERDLPRVAVGSSLVATVAGIDDTFRGEVARVGLEIDPATQTAEVIARIPNPDRRLIAGMFTTVRIEPRGTREALHVPRQSVVEVEGSKYVFVVEDGHVRKQRVEVAPGDGEHAEITRGIEPGTLVATSGVNELEDGAAVTVENGGGTAAAAASARPAPAAVAAQEGAP